MRTARIIRIVLSVFIYFLSLSMSITSILAGYSAINILTTPGNINVPSGTIKSDFDVYSYIQHGHEDFSADIPFNFTNAGYFALTELSIEITLKLEYLESDTQQSVSKTLFSRTDSLPDLNRGETYTGTFNIESNEIIYDNIPDNLFDIIDPDREPILNIYADATLSGSYGIGLYQFDATIENLKIASTSMEDLPTTLQDQLQASQVI